MSRISLDAAERRGDAGGGAAAGRRLEETLVRRHGARLPVETMQLQLDELTAAPGRPHARPAVPLRAPPSLPPKPRKPLPCITITTQDLVGGPSARQDCAICLCERRAGDVAAEMPCGHLFCVECIEPWLARSSSCPVCRYELGTEDAYGELGRKTATAPVTSWRWPRGREVHQVA